MSGREFLFECNSAKEVSGKIMQLNCLGFNAESCGEKTIKITEKEGGRSLSEFLGGLLNNFRGEFLETKISG